MKGFEMQVISWDFLYCILSNPLTPVVGCKVLIKELTKEIVQLNSGISKDLSFEEWYNHLQCRCKGFKFPAPVSVPVEVLQGVSPWQGAVRIPWLPCPGEPVWRVSSELAGTASASKPQDVLFFDSKILCLEDVTPVEGSRVPWHLLNAHRLLGNLWHQSFQSLQSDLIYI